MCKVRVWARMKDITRLYRLVPSIFVPSIFALASCTPRVEIAPSDKPITINLNVKIDHEVRVRVEKDVDKLVENNELF